MRTGCQHNNTNWRPPSPSLPPLLYEINNTAYNATHCLWTFTQLVDSHYDDVPCYYMAPVNVHTCPQHCLRALSTHPDQARVYGSYPYHANSSICLAAIHSGIISDDAGGSLLIEPFYPLTWANDSTQTIFPHNSSLPSLSNGVATLPISIIDPTFSPLTPSPLSSHSYTVRTHGLGARQRQLAPFPPRSSHAHLRMDLQQGPVAGIHLIVGGHNATHYLNDVWLFQPYRAVLTVNYEAAANGRWFRLPDAPFSPRAEMATKVVWGPTYRNVYNRTFGGTHSVLFFFFGGQTGHSCGNRALGQCSDEVWQLNMTRTSFVPGADVEHLNVDFIWSKEPVGHLTFGARCGMGVIDDTRDLTSEQNELIGLVGGQLSYPANDSLCASPIISVNSAYYSTYRQSFNVWSQGRDGPFSPRRSMVEEDSFFTNDDEVLYGGVNRLSVELDKSVSLASGLRYLDHRVDAATGIAVVTRAEMYSDVWSCTLPTPEYDHSPLDCDWHHTYPIADLSRGPPYTPTGSMPIPIAHSAHAPFPASATNWLIRFGGATSEEAVRMWRATTPVGAVDSIVPVDWSAAPANVTLMQQPLWVQGMPEPTAADMEPLRYHLPSAYTLLERELNDPQSLFNRGSPYVLTHLVPMDLAKLQPHITTLHAQPHMMAQTPEEADWVTPQAASALNSTRPHFAFSMQRLGHSASKLYAVTYIGGGHSGAVYYNDWVSFTPQGCFWPMDPSYRSLLGPLSSVVGRMSWAWVLQRQSADLYDYYFAGTDEIPYWTPGSAVDVQCAAGHHFSPPLEDSTATLRCTAAGVWMDLSLGSIRRCVPDRLQCSWPFTDGGYEHCVDPQPKLTGLKLHVVAAFDQVREQPVNYNEGLIGQLPVQWFPLSLHQQLYVYGEWLSYPMHITVLGTECIQPTLLNTTRYCSADRRLCRDFGSVASCTIKAFLDMTSSPTYPVTITVGHRSRFFSSLDVVNEDEAWPKLYPHSQPMSVEIAPPRIRELVSFDCSPNSTALHLFDCPTDRPFWIKACGENIQLYTNNVELPQITLTSTTPLECYAPRREERRDTARPCTERIPDMPCWESYVCSVCEVQPLIGQGHILRIRLSTGLTNDDQNSEANETAIISFATCTAGHRADFIVNQGQVQQQCIECEPGYSTLGLPDQRSCTPCAPGQFSAEWASAECHPCPIGSHSSQQNSSVCAPCGANGWARFEGQSECNECGDALYKRLPPSLPYNVSVAELPSCEACPAGSACDRNGTIIAQPGYFLVIDSGSGAVSSVDCFSTACVAPEGADECRAAAASSFSFDGHTNTTAGALRVGSTGPAVINCCGANRRPAVDGDGVINVLCAACMEGYREIQSECIACEEVRWGQVVGLLLAALLFVYALHRFSHDAGGSATQPILAYFVQMSLLFLASDSLPSLLSLVNIDLVGDGSGGGNSVLRTCVAPLSDEGKMLLRLLSPAIFMGLLAALLGLQLLVRWCINRRIDGSWGDVHGGSHGRRSRLVRAYRLLLPSVSAKLPLVRPVETPKLDDGEAVLTPPSALVFASPTARGKTRVPLWPSHRDLQQSLLTSDPSSSAVEQSDGVGGDVAVVAAATGDSVRGVLVFHLRTLVRLCLFSYNAVTLVSLACFHTRDVLEFGHRLWQYPTISTGDSSYAALAVLFTVVLVCVVLGGPVALLAYLVRCRRQDIIGPGQDAAIRTAADLPSSARMSQTVAVLLTASFRQAYWWYPVFVLVRRLSLIVLLTFVSRGVYSWLTVLNNAFLTTHLLAWPYHNPRDSALELLTLSALATQTAILSAYTSQATRPAWASALLWLLFTAPCLMGFVLALRSWQQRRLAYLAKKRGSGSRARAELVEAVQGVELDKRQHAG